ncbi:Mycothiol maleylpyruvate isomerase N-terminal domain-containing protein [Friedmanniella luteola]|uniref:Mycothiol maleylpyruvate isomerase N-terminal domain-containing protein n=1 Tax=Friedmanniella luteola TaxID=546871 RepID=A0A1H1W9Q8_9ACTN|nr:maleylpyruvate isomerase N-terminal domain-containing protein [Friedmanniella luteola]SDS93401.1 Mycothiol maleylpyruvate isomerase N-terminal domain-containing protein [Friedmanniella luteola]
MTSTWDDDRHAFTDAATWVVALSRQVGDRWDRPGLGEWDVRALVGHTGRALLTVETYLGRPAATVAVSSTAAYYRAARELVGGSEVTERGREAGRALGPDPAAAVAEVVARVLPLVAGCDGAELVTTVVGGMRLADYLPTRVFELAVHGADLAAALDLPLDVPPTAAASALRLVADLAVADGRAGTLLRAVTGRTGLPGGYSVL